MESKLASLICLHDKQQHCWKKIGDVWIIHRTLYHSGSLDSKKSLSTIDAPPGVSVVSKKKSHFFYKWNYFPFALRLPPKTPTSNNHQNWRKNVFLDFFEYSSIWGQAHQTSTGMFSGSWSIFWHPWDPWGHVNSGYTRVLRFVLIILWWWRRLADFSLLWKCSPISAL